MRRTIALLTTATAIAGCEPGPQVPEQATLGSLQANLVIPEDEPIGGIRLDVYDGALVVESRTLTPEPQPIPGTDEATMGGDVLMALRPGTYRAVATALDAAGEPAPQCRPASAEAEVVAGATNEIVLLVPCGDEGTGALDVVVGVDRAPVITDLRVLPSKFTRTCEAVTILAPATDPDGQDLEYEWAVVGGPEGGVVRGGQGAALFGTQVPGDYTVRVTVSAKGGQSASLEFPIHVAEGQNGNCAGDEDQDQVPDLVDNCSILPNPDQADTDGDGVGDACTEGPNAPLRIAFGVNPQLQPARDRLFGEDQRERPVARLADAAGNQADFVADEMLVAGATQGQLDALLARWNGEVLATIDPAELGAPSPPVVHLVRVDTANADPALLPALARKADRLGRGEHGVSSEEGLRLLTVVAHEAVDEGLTVAANWLLAGDDVWGRSTVEAPAGPAGYSPDAFRWPYLSTLGRQQFGVAEAWRMLEVSGRDANRVGIAIADGGFVNSADMSPTTRVFPAGAFGVRNPYDCSGGNPCPWHGTMVAATAAALPDNGFGVAGSGGIVADPILIQSPNPDFFEFVRFALRTIPEAAASGPRILNISASGDIPAVACAFACPALDVVTNIVRNAGILVVASAGNNGLNVDREDCLWPFGCWESVGVVPCELSNVLCVGGLGWDSNDRDRSSAWGSASGGGTVDLYGPFTVYTLAPDAAGALANQAAFASGTSFSSPFVAGCAALTWAANPGLSATGVERMLLDTSRGLGGVRRKVDCHGAVRTALGGDAPPMVNVTAPADGARWERGGGPALLLAATANDEEDGVLTPQWSSSRDGFLGRGHSLLTSSLTRGRHVITATVQDSRGWRVSDSVTVDVGVRAPVVSILSPAEGAEIPVSQRVLLDADSSDLGRMPPLPDGDLAWYVDARAGAPIARGHRAEIAGDRLAQGDHTLILVATYEAGEIEVRRRIRTVANPVDLPPTARITAPAAGSTQWGDIFMRDGIYADVELVGEASDREDGALPDASIRWIDQPEGGAAVEVGHGRRLTARLRTGRWHTVTMEATDTAGNVTRTSVRFLVMDIPY